MSKYEQLAGSLLFNLFSQLNLTLEEGINVLNHCLKLANEVQTTTKSIEKQVNSLSVN